MSLYLTIALLACVAVAQIAYKYQQFYTQNEDVPASSQLPNKFDTDLNDVCKNKPTDSPMGKKMLLKQNDEDIVKLLKLCDFTRLYDIKDTIAAFDAFEDIVLDCTNQKKDNPTLLEDDNEININKNNSDQKSYKNRNLALLDIDSTPAASLNKANHFFSTLGESLATNILERANTTEFNLVNSIELGSVHSNFELKPTNEKEILNILQSFRKKRQPIYNSLLSYNVIVEAKHVLVPPLAYITNLSFATGIVPDSIKVSIVIPKLKTGDTKDPSNYRPIAHSDIVSKVVEKVVGRRLSSFLESNKLVSNHQFGYRRGKLTKTAIAEMFSSEKSLMTLPNTMKDDPAGIYLGDYYVKDFKYIGPEAMVVKKNAVKDMTLLEKWLLEFVKGLKQFFYQGSLHGVKYIFEPTLSMKERFTWVLIMLISIAVCAVHIIQLFMKWTSTPFVNVIDSAPSPVWSVPFPTVVLCPHLHVKLSYENISEMDDLDQFFASLVCPLMSNKKITEHHLDLEQINLLHDFLMKATPTCDEVVKTCNWPAIHYTQWQRENCCELFQPIFTNYGLCFAFNSLPLNGMSNDTLPWQRSFNDNASAAALRWDLDAGYPKIFPLDPRMQPLRVSGSGEANGLGLELYLNTSEHQYACDGNSIGFTVLVSAPTDHVYTSTVLRLPMDKMTTIEVSPRSYKTDATLRELTPAQRQCFFQDERKLEYYHFYTDSNCKHDMLVRQARNECDCVLFNWPRKQIEEPICSTKEEFDCIELVKAEIDEQLIYAYFADGDEMDHNEESVSCHPSCNDVIYTSQVFYSDLTTDQDDSRHWLQPKSGEVTQINVHFYDDIFLGHHRHAQYDKYYFVGATGGLLSLFLGFSIISVAELVYFVILRPIYLVLREAITKKFN